MIRRYFSLLIMIFVVGKLASRGIPPKPKKLWKAKAISGTMALISQDRGEV